MLFPAYINSPLEPDDDFDGCVEPSEYILLKVAGDSSLHPPFLCSILECSFLYSSPRTPTLLYLLSRCSSWICLPCYTSRLPYYIRVLICDQATVD